MQLEFSDETQESDKSLSDEDGTLPYHCPPERSKGVLCSSAGEEIPLLSQLSVCEKDLGGREDLKPLERTLWNLKDRKIPSIQTSCCKRRTFSRGSEWSRLSDWITGFLKHVGCKMCNKR